MNESIYVILINGRPYRKERAIRTYVSSERAEKEAKKLSRYRAYEEYTFKVAEFAIINERFVAGVTDEYVEEDVE
ncbi:hypothetical protein [Paenibacillus sp. TC-CSREp1]|uniref:hypothetical protein n=1 Tax=Paenibacillus sp. TC-CSREp1 TaxID=3410089 RepID=UPI003CF85D54